MIQIYRPNKAIKGFACSFWTSRYGFFATIIKQSGWDESTQTGSFKESLNDPNRHVSIKLSSIEAGAILDCIERNRPFTTFHTNNNDVPKSISFTPWMQNMDGASIGTPPIQKGFSFSITSSPKDANKNSFFIGLTCAEARVIREFLVYSLQQSFVYTRGATEVLSTNPTEPNPEVDVSDKSTAVESLVNV